jgi:hypothetical protein
MSSVLQGVSSFLTGASFYTTLEAEQRETSKLHIVNLMDLAIPQATFVSDIDVGFCQQVICR